MRDRTDSFAHHGAEREVLADVSQEWDELKLSKPFVVVGEDPRSRSKSRNTLTCALNRSAHAATCSSGFS